MKLDERLVKAVEEGEIYVKELDSYVSYGVQAGIDYIATPFFIGKLSDYGKTWALSKKEIIETEVRDND